ncbi:hypothetical protein [Aliarcobacter butzleri]|uniref:hypothetical protein n=1 Tax=Aliarcobacter butzleri TaxID=28197 RepID=UPI00263E47E5|nr:hypothetical protein [Aliarcobacter butzleri]MDN5100511.1 hypothetical protein [Aliarcobacter butzleri]
MQISNTQTQTYSYNQTSNTTNKSDNTDTSNSFDTQLSEEENIKKSSSKIIEYLEKNDKFSSLTKEDEELFRDILADSVFSGDEMKRLNYEQFKKLSDLVNPANTSNINIEELPGVLLQGTYLSSMTDNEDFNKALFETAKNIDNNKERMDFLDSVSSNLGYNNKQVLFGKGSIEENIQAEIAREKEKYKDFDNKDQILAGIIQDIKNWKITDYGSFIKNLTDEYKSLSEHPLLSSEAKLKYKKYSEYTTNMEINYNKAKNEPKYV